MTRPAALLAYAPHLHAETLPPPLRARLEGLVELLHPDPQPDLLIPALRPLLPRLEVLVTGWGARPITAEVLDAAPRLRLVAHMAGTVKALLPPDVWGRGIQVCSAAAANALPVAEYALAMVLLSNKQVFRLRRRYAELRRHRRPWDRDAPGLGNYGKVVGVVGASRIGRRVIELLRPFSVRVLVSDPYLDREDAARLGVEAVPLDALLARSDVVTLHAPSLPGTRHLISRRRLALMRDGAVLINTARGALVDQDALVEETRSGRLDAVLDVTEPDALPPDSPLYDIPNVFLTPHVAGALGGETQRLAELVLDEIARFRRGEALHHAVAAGDLGRIA